MACHGQGSALVVVGAELLEVFDEAARVSERDASDGRSVLCSCFGYQGEPGDFSDVFGRIRGSSYSCNMTRSVTQQVRVRSVGKFKRRVVS